MFQKFYELGGSIVYTIDFGIVMLTFRRSPGLNGQLGFPLLIQYQFGKHPPVKLDSTFKDAIIKDGKAIVTS